MKGAGGVAKEGVCGMEETTQATLFSKSCVS